MPHEGLVGGKKAEDRDVDFHDWEDVSLEIERVLAKVDMVITYGEGRLIDGYRQLNALSLRHGGLHDRRVCVDGLARLAGVTNLEKDQWGYFSPLECARKSGLTALGDHPEHLSANVILASIHLFDWSHEKMHGMHFEAVLPGPNAVKLYSLPIHLPTKSGFELEAYQEDVIRKSLAHAELGRGGLTVKPTGSGKTIVSIVRNASIMAALEGKRCLVLAESPKVLRQLLKTYRELYPFLHVSQCFSGQKDLTGTVVIASRQQLALVLDELQDHCFFMLDIDEAHHAASAQYKDILEAIKHGAQPVLVFGETATPRRPDKRSLRPIFGQVTGLVRLQEVRETGRIVDLEVIRGNLISEEDEKRVIELSAQKVFGSSAQLDREISHVINTPEHNKGVVSLYQRYAGSRLTVVYAVNIDHAEELKRVFVSSGIDAECLHSRDGRSERQRFEILDRFENNCFPVLINVMSLIEGWDCPPASCAIVARPANHPSILEQIVGRVLRASPGKHNALLIEVGVNTESLGQFMFQFFDHSLGLNGARIRSAKNKLRLGHDFPMELEQQNGRWEDGQHICLPPMMPLGKGWLGLRLEGRLIACRASGGEWLALEMRDPTVVACPVIREVPDLRELVRGAEMAWANYREAVKLDRIQRQGPRDGAKATVTTMLQYWGSKSRKCRAFMEPGEAKAAVALRLSVLRWNHVYQHLYGIQFMRFERINDFYSWLCDEWKPNLEGETDINRISDELNIPPVDVRFPAKQRYHECLLEGFNEWLPQVSRVNRWWENKQLCYLSKGPQFSRPLPATNYINAIERIKSAAFKGGEKLPLKRLL